MKKPASQLQRDVASTLSAAIARPMASPTLTHDVAGRRKGLSRDTHSFRLDVDRIRPDEDQVRQINKSAADPGVKELAQSIDEQGLRNYPEVRYIAADDIYELISGERRFTAMTKILNWKEIPVHVVEVDEDQIVWLQLHENVHRSDLHALELADALHKAMRQQKLSLTQVAKKLNKSLPLVQKAITVATRLSDQARRVLQPSVQGRNLDILYQVATLPEDQQVPLAKKIVSDKLTTRQVVAQAKSHKQKPAAKRKGRSGRPSKTQPFSKSIKASNGGVVTLKFRKSRVSQLEQIAAVTETLAALKSEQPRKAA